MWSFIFAIRIIKPFWSAVESKTEEEAGIATDRKGGDKRINVHRDRERQYTSYDM